MTIAVSGRAGASVAAAVVVTGLAWGGGAEAGQPAWGAPRGRDVSSSAACRAGDLSCVDQVIERMRRLEHRLSWRCDHDAVFALTYLRTTELYRETAETIGYDDLASVTREDALFADYYFRAHEAYHRGRPVPAAWQIAFDTAHTRALSAEGDAALGVNAHVQRDLPFVLYELYEQGHSVSYEDHTRVNDFLAQLSVAPEIIERLDPSYPTSRNLERLVAWREAAWQNFERLRDAAPVERVVIAAEIEYAAAATAAAIASATAYPPGSDSSERDAYCRQNR